MSCGVYTEGGGMLVGFCVYKEDIDRIRLLSDVYGGGIKVFVVLSGENVGTTCVSVAFSGVNEDMSG